jgi:hypothetical protein
MLQTIWIIVTEREGSGYILIEFLSHWVTCLEFQSLQSGPRTLCLSVCRKLPFRWSLRHFLKALASLRTLVHSNLPNPATAKSTTPWWRRGKKVITLYFINNNGYHGDDNDNDDDNSNNNHNNSNNIHVSEYFKRKFLCLFSELKEIHKQFFG